ncbi:hypothetical protein VB264_22890 [Arcicella aquatica]|uniref:Uncharacterized protein n=1 Tax=Arcicella aquatica TaxID=217141 RepID=A0ABU5QU76_9BACT|nr:hypothetical protein [Arcicella aquatica]MEA5260663.1 hypothetical protein [Arcicella aquatica]
MVEVKGSTAFLSKTRFYSGFFDEEGLKVYFNEFTQPKNGKFKDSTKIVPLSGNNENEKLVFLLSTNAEDIANQITSLSQTKETINSIISIANKDNFKQIYDLSQQQDYMQFQNKLVFDDSFIKNIEDKDLSSVSSELLAFLNALSYDLGNKTKFDTIKKAKEWLATYKEFNAK